MAADDLGLENQMMADSAEGMAASVYSTGIALKEKSKTL